jgi:hypothetical protein
VSETRVNPAVYDTPRDKEGWGVIRGLNIADLETTTEEERHDFLVSHGGRFNYPDGVPSYQMHMRVRPDLIKTQYRVFRAEPESWFRQGHFGMSETDTHHYLIRNYAEGIYYNLRLHKNQGYTRAEVWDMFAMAFLHTCAMGHVAASLDARIWNMIQDWSDEKSETQRPNIPPHWEFDPDAFKSGMDFEDPDCSPGELKLLEDWLKSNYEGEVPPWFTYMSEYCPKLMKAMRGRFENALRALPKQFMPMNMLHWDVIRGFPEGIRENVLLAKAFGMTKDEMLGSVHVNAASYAGFSALSVFDKAAGDIVRNWK